MKNTELAPVTFYTYIAKCKPSEVDAMLKKAGYTKKPTNLKVRSLMLADYVKQDKENALIEIAKIHPDRELILKDISINSADGISECEPCKEKETIKEDSNLNNVMEAAGTFIPASQSFDAEKKLSDKTVNLLILSGSVIFITAIMGLTISALRK